MTGFVDVHCHLTHKRYETDLNVVIQRAEKAGVKSIVCNGLEPISNRQTLELAEKYPTVKPALGIYPINALQKKRPKLDHDLPTFNVEEEIKFIAEQAKNRKIIAIGECGLDGYWVDQDYFPEQEEVFLQLLEIAMNNDIPVIVHSRKMDKRMIEILHHHKANKVDFHCFGGKTKLAQKAAEAEGTENWCFSIPANSHNNEAFAKMLRTLPIEKILTETDSPYLAPVRGERNEPVNVIGTIEHFAGLRELDLEEVKKKVWQNYMRLFKENQ